MAQPGAGHRQRKGHSKLQGRHLGAEMDLAKAGITSYNVARIWLLLEARSTWKQLKTLLWEVAIFPKRIPICPHHRSLVKLRWE